MPDERLICKICNRPIDRVFGADSPDQPEDEWTFEGYAHLDRKPDYPHDPDPIPAEEADFIDQVCDFCGQPDIAWVFPVESDKMRWLGPNVTISDTAWAACQGCHDAIGRLDAVELAEYVVHRHPSAKNLPHELRHIYEHELCKIYTHFMKVKKQPVTLNEYVS